MGAVAQPANWGAVYLTETNIWTNLAEKPSSAPPGWWGGGLGELLSRLAPRFGREGVLMLARPGAELLGLPAHGTLPKGGLHDHPALQDLERAGWRCSGIGDWSTAARDDKVIRIGLVHMMDLSVDKFGVVTGFPLYDGTGDGIGISRTLRALAAWHQLTGSTWSGTPGMAGLQVMQNLAPHKGEKGRQAPTWKPSETKGGKALGWGPDGAVEDDYRPEHWRHSAGDAPFLHWYDKNRAYISAAQVCEVCPWTLKNTGRTDWAPRLAGWWQIEIAPWNDPRLPDPAGYLPGNPLVRWVTHPRMALLHELTEQGKYGGYRVLDSWTGPARDSVLKPWAERMRDAYATAGEIDDPSVRNLVRQAVKRAGRATLGMLDRSSCWAYRPDWWYAVVAMNAANTWRKCRDIVAGGGRVVRINTDAVAVASTILDATAAAPAPLMRAPKGEQAPRLDPSGELLGFYKPGKTYRVRRAA